MTPLRKIEILRSIDAGQSVEIDASSEELNEWRRRFAIGGRNALRITKRYDQKRASMASDNQ